MQSTEVTPNRGANSPLRNLLDDHFAVHHHPVTGKSAKVRIASGVRGGLEINRERLLRLNNVRVANHVIGFRDVMV